MTLATRVAAIATLVSQIVIVGTGGAVRLTGSGLGCSTWPTCTPESFVPVAEQGVHGIIEFSNRVMGGVVVGIAVWMLVLAWVHRRERRGVLALASTILALSVAQALIGAVVVWLHLLPSTVGLHFVLSAVLVGLAAWLAWLVLVGRGTAWGGTRLQRVLTAATAVLLAIVVGVGILTTGSGPHAGDDAAARNGLDPAILQHLHAVPAYALLAAVVALVLLARGSGGHGRATLVLLATLVLQIVVGLVQANTGLPVALVGIHMVLSVIAVAACTVVVLALRTDARAATPTQEPAKIGA